MSSYTINLVLNTPTRDGSGAVDFFIESIQSITSDGLRHEVYSINVYEHGFECCNCNERYDFNVRMRTEPRVIKELIDKNLIEVTSDRLEVKSAVEIIEDEKGPLLEWFRQNQSLNESDVSGEMPENEIVIDELSANFSRKSTSIAVLNRKSSLAEIENKSRNQIKSSQKKNGIRNPKKPSWRRQPPCKNCGKIFSYRRTADEHKCYTVDMNIHQCRHCEVCFSNEVLFLYHLRREHKPFKKDHICELCGTKFGCRTGLSYHLKHSKAHKPVSDSMSPEKERLYECHYCNGKFLSKYSVWRHIKRHFLSMNQTKREQCSICGQSFSTQLNLRRHIQTIHEGLKPYACPICQKQFTSQHYVKTHMTHHKGERKFKCKFCDLTYRDPGSASGHMRKFHLADYEIYKKNRKLLLVDR